MKIKTDSIVLHWICEKCEEMADQDMLSLSDSGTALCPGCGNDMTLRDHATVEGAVPDLLDACESLLFTPALNFDDLEDADVEAIEQAHAAIAKATEPTQ